MSKQDMASYKDALLLNPDVQAMIQRMVDQGVYSITSKLEKTGIVYPALQELLPNKSEKEVNSFLNELTKADILRSKLIDKVIICPTCGSPSVYSKYNCPRCSSFDIGKKIIIEHVRCGFIGSGDKFQNGDIMICPKCKNVVTENDYRKIGTSFECNSCGTRFEAPRMSHKCNSCEDVFTYKEARYEPLLEFELTEDTKRTVAKGTLPLASIIATLKENGFDVGSRRELTGKSGATHTFDIVAKKKSVLVVGNFAFEPKEEDIIGLFAKKYDVDPTFTLLIALSSPTKDEETVSKAYGVKIISPIGTHSIGEQIVELVDSLLQSGKGEDAKFQSSPEPIQELKHEPVLETKQQIDEGSKKGDQKAEMNEQLEAPPNLKNRKPNTKDKLEEKPPSTQVYTETEGEQESDSEEDNITQNHDRRDWDSEGF